MKQQTRWCPVGRHLLHAIERRRLRRGGGQQQATATEEQKNIPLLKGDNPLFSNRYAEQFKFKLPTQEQQDTSPPSMSSPPPSASPAGWLAVDDGHTNHHRSTHFHTSI